MTPEQIIAQQEAQARQQALNLADKRMPADASPADVIKEAERVLTFLKAGMTVAV
jgi:hypothetical protein